MEEEASFFERERDKLTAELASLAQAIALDADRLRAHQRDLLAGEPAIHDESARLTAVRDVCASVVVKLRDAVGAADARQGPQPLGVRVVDHQRGAGLVGQGEVLDGVPDRGDPAHDRPPALLATPRAQSTSGTCTGSRP